MKTPFQNTLFFSCIIILSVSCSQDGIDYLKGNEEISIRSSDPKDATSHTLVYGKEELHFSTKRDLYSFLAEKDNSTKVFLAEIILSDLHQEYAAKFGKEYYKEAQVQQLFEKDLEEEFSFEYIPLGYRCVLCTIMPEQCNLEEVLLYSDMDRLNLNIYDEVLYMGDHYRLKRSDISHITETETCLGVVGKVQVGNLNPKFGNWDNRISSFRFETELSHESAIVTLYSEENLTGAELVYYMSQDLNVVRELDLSKNFWVVRNIPRSVDNMVSSFGIKYILPN